MKSLVVYLIGLGVAAASFLSPQLFQSEVHDTDTPYLVILTNGNEADGNTILQELAEKLDLYGIKSGVVDCSERMNQRGVCKGIPSLPMVQLYVSQPQLNPYTKKNYRSPLSYNEGGDIKSVDRFIQKSFPSNIKKASSLSDIEQIRSPNVSTVLLFSDKEVVSMYFKSLQYPFQNSLNFVHVTPHATEAHSTFGITSFPTLLVLRAGSEDRETYPSESDPQLKNRESVVNWLNQFAAVISEPEEKIEKSDDPPVQSEVKAESKAASKYFQLQHHVQFDDIPQDEAWILLVSSQGNWSEVSLSPEWIKTAKWCEGRIKAAELLCPEDRDGVSPFVGSLCFDSKISLPYLFVLGYGATRRKLLSGSNFKLSHFSYTLQQGELARKSAGESLPEQVVHFIDGENSFQQLVSDSTQQGILGCAVVSEKEAPPAFLRNLALQVSHAAKIGYVVGLPAYLAKWLGPISLPSMICTFPQLKAGSKPGEVQITKFDPDVFGPVRFGSLHGFVMYNYQVSGLKPVEKAETPTVHIDGEVQTQVAVIRSEEDWIKVCSSSGFRGICALELTSAASGPDGTDSNRGGLVLKDSIIGLGGSGAAFKFMTVDGGCFQSFASAFEVSVSDMPTVVAYSPSKGRFATFKGSYTAGGVKNFFESVLNGGTKTLPISFRPILGAECDPSIQEIGNTSENSDDANDFLEEIRKEEAEQALKRKKELEEELKAAEIEAKASKSKGKKKVGKKKSKKSKGSTSSEL